MIDDLGLVGLPLSVRDAEEIKKCCNKAPFGRGENTLVDETVRRTWQLSPEGQSSAYATDKKVIDRRVDVDICTSDEPLKYGKTCQMTRYDV